MLACDAVRVRNNAWPSVTEQHMAMAHVGHLHQAGLALAPGACPAAFVRAVIVWRVRSPVINMCDVWLQDCQGLHGVRLSITSYVYALITLQILWPHWPLQRDDRALGHVPRHGLAHVQRVLLPAVVAQHPPVHGIPELQAVRGGLSPVSTLHAMRQACIVKTGQNRSAFGRPPGSMQAPYACLGCSSECPPGTRDWVRAPGKTHRQVNRSPNAPHDMPHALLGAGDWVRAPGRRTGRSIGVRMRHATGARMPCWAQRTGARTRQTQCRSMGASTPHATGRAPCCTC